MRTLLALTVLPWLTLSSTTVKNIAVPPDVEVAFKCNVTTLPVRWMWFPKHFKCAGESSMKVIYTIDMYGNKTSVQRFKKRLTLRGDPRAGEHALVLSDSVMSDSGTYSCADSKKPIQSYELEVTAGCYHNVQIKNRSRSRTERVILSCSSCADGKQIKNFSWTFNGKPVNDLQGIKQTRSEIIIQKVTTNDEGKWICASVDDPSQFSEYCLDLGSKTGRKDNEHKYPKNTTQVTGLNKSGLTDPLKAVIVAVVVVIVVASVTSVWLYLYRRKRSRRLNQNLTVNSAPNRDFSTPVSVGTGQAVTGTATQDEDEGQYASLTVRESAIYCDLRVK
ncbi:hypothetical protein AOXY_G27754 [Acipenser oxyrinchus oxyrinchus]|uniref:Ig-like domain-containing protein n=1 Tax=Acipenser oxyrinchus oxyrinchus TaxID=40147 RepID=A0AAD8CR47_ACIOX|nr:hypothetical protein AOXY_G27754 [Acipenser oxyrinchus oxyrinchus]